MKNVLFALLIYVAALVSCSNDDAVVQGVINENIALISSYFAGTDHLLILVGDKEVLVDDMSCNSHDQELVAQMFASGDPHFIHLAPEEGLTEGADNGQYIEAPENIKTAIDYVNHFSSDPDAVDDDDGSWAFNFVDESEGIFNGECQDLGVHHLGILENGKGDLADDISYMNEAGYGEETWNGLPIFGNNKKLGQGPCDSNFKDCWVGGSQLNHKTNMR